VPTDRDKELTILLVTNGGFSKKLIETEGEKHIKKEGKNTRNDKSQGFSIRQ